MAIVKVQDDMPRGAVYYKIVVSILGSDDITITADNIRCLSYQYFSHIFVKKYMDYKLNQLAIDLKGVNFSENDLQVLRESYQIFRLRFDAGVCQLTFDEFKKELPCEESTT